MELLILSRSKIKIMLSEADMARYGVDAAEVESGSVRTRSAFRCILDEVRRQSGFDTAGERLFVQLYASRTGGCEIFITKLGAAELFDRRDTGEEKLWHRVMDTDKVSGVPGGVSGVDAGMDTGADMGADSGVNTGTDTGTGLNAAPGGLSDGRRRCAFRSPCHMRPVCPHRPERGTCAMSQPFRDDEEENRCGQADGAGGDLAGGTVRETGGAGGSTGGGINRGVRGEMRGGSGGGYQAGGGGDLTEGNLSGVEYGDPNGMEVDDGAEFRGLPVPGEPLTRVAAMQFPDLDTLLAVSRRLLCMGYDGPSDAYICALRGQDGYCLLLDVPDTTVSCLPHPFAFLAEYGTEIDGEAVRLYLSEHGRSLVCGRAVQVLGVL